MPISVSSFAETGARLFDRFFRTGVMLASQFALIDEVQSKQIQFDASSATAGTASTIAAGANGGINIKATLPAVPGTNFSSKWVPAALTTGTSTTPAATSCYVSQIFVPHQATITGIKVNNGATVGTNAYIVALFDATGAVVANSALAGTTTAGADAYQTIAFTGTAVVNTGMYWVGLYVNGTTDRFRSLPAVAQIGGLAGEVTGQTFGTVAAIAAPTTFTADKGPVAFTY